MQGKYLLRLPSLAQWAVVADTELLEQLATAYGFSMTYRGLNNEIVASPRESLVYLLRALDVPLSDAPAPEELAEALHELSLIHI